MTRDRDKRKGKDERPKVEKDTVKDLEKGLEDLQPGENAADVKGGARRGRHPGRTTP